MAEIASAFVKWGLRPPPGGIAGRCCGALGAQPVADRGAGFPDLPNPAPSPSDHPDPRSARARSAISSALVSARNLSIVVIPAVATRRRSSTSGSAVLLLANPSRLRPVSGILSGDGRTGLCRTIKIPRPGPIPKVPSLRRCGGKLARGPSRLARNAAHPRRHRSVQRSPSLGIALVANPSTARFGVRESRQHPTTRPVRSVSARPAVVCCASKDCHAAKHGTTDCGSPSSEHVPDP